MQSDPSSLTALLLRLLAPTTFTELLALLPNVQPGATAELQVETALLSPLPPVQMLGLELLFKASATPADAGILASWPAVVKSVLTLALTARDTGVANRAALLLVALLQADRGGGDGGVLWRRVFADEAVCSVFFSLTSAKGLPSSKEKTEAQSRLLALVPSLASIDFEALCRPRFEATEARYSSAGTTSTAGYGGLLLYCAAGMVRERDDVIMHMLLLEFYTALLDLDARAVDPTDAGTRRAWDLLHALGKVAHTVTLAVNPQAYTDDVLEHGLLQSKAAAFVARMVELFPAELDMPLPAGGPALLGDGILSVVRTHLDDPHVGPHTPSLQMLRAMPPQWLAGKGVVARVPLSPPFPEFLRTLARLLAHQPLYRQYAAHRPELWEVVVRYASSVALGDAAVAALDLVEAVALAAAGGGGGDGGGWGVVEILRAPSVMPMLVAVPRLPLGARVGAADSGAVAQSVLQRRWEVARSVLACLISQEAVADSAEEGESPWKSALQQRVALGAAGGTGEGKEFVEVATI